MVFLNGDFLDPADARVSAFDAGLLHAVGLFETMLAGVGPGGAWVFGLEDHLERLTTSARDLGLSDSLRRAGLRDAVLQTVRKADLPRARVRLTITGGDLSLLARDNAPPHDPTILIAAQPATVYPDAFFDQGVTAVIADLRVNPLDPLAGHKTLNYWARLRDLQTAARKHAGEALVFQVSNLLAGGCVSNACLVKDGVLLTPIARGEEPPGGIPSPVLPGITRAFILDRARARGIDTRPRMLTIDDILGADELFLTNSSWGVLPVVQVERRTIADGSPGELTRALRQAWLDAADDASL